MKKGSIIIGVVIFAVVSLIIWRSCNGKSDVELDGKEKLTVQLQWFDGAQFCGLYVAQEKGFFEEEKLVVELNPVNSFTSDPIAILLDGKADIAIATADQVLINKDKGKEIKAFGNVFNRSLACFMYKDGKSINSLTDFQGKKIAVYKKFDTENILLALKKKDNLNIKENDIYQAGAIDAFVNGEYDILGSYLHNEPIDMRMQGIQVGIIDPEKYGVKFYSDTYIYVPSTEIGEGKEKENKKLERFIRAANKGWEYTRNNPDEAIKIMFAQAKNLSNNETRKEKETKSLQVLLKYLGAGENQYCSFMEKDRWESMEKNLFDIGRISQTGLVNDLCDFDLVSEAYDKK
jgi:putative hydroxymethylpyrimidine transport system substrate-binding protein